MSGCLFDKQPVKVNANLPVINGIKTISDMTQIAFEWLPTDNPSVAGYYLFRSAPNAQNTTLNLVATIKDRFTTHYVDKNLVPAMLYKYEIRSYDKNGDMSDRGEVISVYTHKLIDSVSYAQVLGNLPGRAKILWKPHSDQRVSSYIIERHEIGTDDWKKIAEIKGRLSVEFIDAGVKPDQEYEYRIFVKTNDGVISMPSAVFSAKTKPLPDTVTNLQATKNLPQKIILTWDQNENLDFSHYVIYSSISSLLPVTKLATTTDTRYEDEVTSNGSSRYYKVTAVDLDGQESKPQDEPIHGSTISRPKAPSFVSAFFEKNVIDLEWKGDQRCQNYVLFRASGSDKKKINIPDTQYIDKNINIGEKYTYQVHCTDENGMASHYSNKITVKAE